MCAPASLFDVVLVVFAVLVVLNGVIPTACSFSQQSTDNERKQQTKNQQTGLVFVVFEAINNNDIVDIDNNDN